MAAASAQTCSGPHTVRTVAGRLAPGQRSSAPDRRDTVPSLFMGARAERQAARERVDAYRQAQLAELLTSVAATIDRYRAGEIDACTADEMVIPPLSSRRQGTVEVLLLRRRGSHAELMAGVLDQMAADAKTVN